MKTVSKDKIKEYNRRAYLKRSGRLGNGKAKMLEMLNELKATVSDIILIVKAINEPLPSIENMKRVTESDKAIQAVTAREFPAPRGLIMAIDPQMPGQEDQTRYGVLPVAVAPDPYQEIPHHEFQNECPYSKDFVDQFLTRHPELTRERYIEVAGKVRQTPIFQSAVVTEDWRHVQKALYDAGLLEFNPRATK